MVFDKRASRVGLTVLLALLATICLSATARAERVVVKVEAANIRSGPGTDYQMLWRVEEYTPLEVLSRQGEWVFFKDFEGTRGWIFKDLIASNIKAVITTKDMCNIRSGPGTSHRVLFQAERGVPFKVLERKGKWIHILHADGDKGWIYETLVW